MPVLDFRPVQQYGETIRKNDGYRASSHVYYPLVVLGAGESGIAMGCRLKEAGYDQFRIFERQSGIGGTWWINRYPGVACDIPAVFYSFSFCPNLKWSKFHPEGAEIVQYLQDVCNLYGIVDKIQLNTDVRTCKWIEADKVWEVTLRHLIAGSGDLSEYDRNKKMEREGKASVYIEEEVIRCKVLVSAVGGLVEPQLFPNGVPGQKNFKGEIFHSARWRYDVDLKDKDVIVVGTGCSAAQFVPLLAEKYGAKSVTQLMRSPPWVVPKVRGPGGEKNWERLSPWLMKNVPGFHTFIRTVVASSAEYDWRLFGSEEYHEKERAKYEAKLIQHLHKSVPEKYWEILTPNYGVGCKRRIFDTTWLPGLHDPRINLTTVPLTGCSEKSVTLGPGRTYPEASATSKAPKEKVTIPADVIILANGFQTTKWLHPLEITGRGGKTMEDVFEERGGPQMYLGTALDGFPNFFTLFGPNTVTGHSSVILASENMAQLSLNFIKPILAGDVETAEIKKEAEIEYTRDCQAALKKRVWNSGGCHSWYQSEDGWNSTAYPYSQIKFTLKCMFPTFSHWDIKYTKKGQQKRRVKALVTSSAVIAATMLVTGYYLEQSWFSQGVSYLAAPVKATLRKISGVLDSAVSRL